jgi:tetratricopeptide (TPR) repeat protein
LKRRVHLDPASIAFAALAEEYRRGGQFEESIATCLAGLQRHPAYLSARVTLGRSLLELGRYDEAREQLEHVLRVAPENLAAIRGLAEIHHRRGELPEAIEPYRSNADVEPAGHDAPPLRQAEAEIFPTPESPPATAEAPPEPVVAAPSRPALRPVQVSAAPSTEPHAGPDPRPWPKPAPKLEPKPELTREPAPATVAAAVPLRAVPPVTPRRVQPGVAALPALEAFLAAIVRAREASARDRIPTR